MTREAANRLLDRVEDAETQGDPACRRCRGDGSREVLPRGLRRIFCRCECRDRISAAYDLVGDERLAKAAKRAGRPDWGAP